MSEWWTYRLDDFLLFAPRTYWRLFEAQNAALWPLHPVTVAAGLALLLLIASRPDRARFWTGLVLAALWAFVGWSFLMNRYAAINWAVAYVASAFFLQAGLLLLAALLPRGLAFARHDATSWAGLLLALVGLLLYPALPLVFSRPWTSAEVFGIAPDPTAIVTLGLLMAARGAWLAVLLPIPLLWCLVSGLTLWAMDDAQAWLPLAVAAIGVLLALARLLSPPAPASVPTS
ncbi:conserved hypothetical protein [Ancylobacter novellus DSM 506]|uniref:MFS transporter permease n=1 Tax=Ancylobacter novellus (strain ATCC 8093 / DSM 506 / JCM 20403 / CCM 1077 / IAM 12100 / NBRC 12443 / NCIMB 10456) TaxID=639283 RepID=D7AA80_ANCN5|nr:DUF6064 family protein [Ancylobacter novellus]ADH90867.1 conserved hypothetical protein [Ancylobacter novellus DSM 506]